MRRFGFVVVATAVFSAGCTKDQPVQPPTSGGPAYMISDGAHGGNAHFFFLPPLVPDPSALFHPGTFNSQLSPLLEVCRLTGDPRNPVAPSCAETVFGPTAMALDLANEQYRVNWDTKSPPLDVSAFYRITVRGAARGTALGFLDVDPVDEGMKNLRTGDVVQFQDGRALPIKVRIEEGAFGSTNPDHVEQVVPNTITTPTGTLDVTTTTGFAGARFPDGWLPSGFDQVVVIIERIAVSDGSLGTSCLQSGLFELEGCYRFRTDPDLNLLELRFSKPVITGVCFEMPIHTSAPYQLHRREEDAAGTPFGATVALVDAEAPFLTCDKFAPTPPPSPLGALRSGHLMEFAKAGWQALGRGIERLVTPQALHAVDLGAGGSTDGFSRFGYARGATMVKLAATDNQVALTGTTVPLDPTVCLTSLHPLLRPLVSEPVTFTVTGGGGTVGGGTSTIAHTGSDGCASAPWVLGSTTAPAGNRMTAAAAAFPRTVEFVATGVTLQVDAGSRHSCAVIAAGQAFCWGINDRGRLGDGTTVDRSIPTPVAGGLMLAAVDAGFYHSCGVTTGGAAYCWGGNSGQLGDGTATDRLVPTLVAGGLTFASVSAGSYHTCGLTTSGAAYCWGGNYGGALGDGTTTDRLIPTPVAGGLSFASLSAGFFHTCGVTTSGTAYCWGYNPFGGLGDGTQVNRLVPTVVVGGQTFAAVSAAIYHTCGVTTSGAAYCWGSNGNGRVGDGTTTDRLVPTAVTGGQTFIAISTGDGHTCGVTSSSAAYCWGLNGSGQLGDGTTTDRLAPTPVAGGLTFAEVSGGDFHTCGATTNGAAYCWGYNGLGEVGDGTMINRLVPTAVVFATALGIAPVGGKHNDTTLGLFGPAFLFTAQNVGQN